MSSSMVLQPHNSWATRHDPSLTASQQRQVEGLRRLNDEANRRGWSPASLISMLPFSFPVTGPIHQVDLKIPHVPLEKEHWALASKLKLSTGVEVPYVQYVFAQWKPLQQKYLEGGVILSDAEEINSSGHIWPIDQAYDAVGQNNRGAERGGVFCYEGIHQPFATTGRRDEHSAQIQKERELFEDAHSKMMAYFTGFYAELSSAYMSRASTRTWQNLVGKGSYHRWITQYLYLIGSITELPDWYEEISAPGAKAHKKCGRCGHNIEPGCVICSPQTCGWVADPFRAFNELHMDADTPGAKLVAMRLNPAELATLLKANRFTTERLDAWGIEHSAKKK